MSLRLQVLVAEKPHYNAQFYAARPALAARPYADQLAALRADWFAWQVFWADALADLGYETDVVIANAEPLQKQWASEHGTPYAPDRWLYDITAAQVSAFRPDVLFVTSYHAFDAPYLRQLRADNPSIRLVLGWCGAPYTDPDVFHAFDIVLSNIPELVAHFCAQGHDCRHVNHAFEPRVLDHIDTQAPPNAAFTFVGGIIRRDQFHQGREELLLDLLRRTDLQVYTTLLPAPPRVRYEVALRRLVYDSVQRVEGWGVPDSALRKLPLIGRIARWKQRPRYPSLYGEPYLLHRTQPPVFGLAMYQQLHDSRVTLNTHIDISAHSASNLRLYEATGVGACLLTDWKDNIADLFEPDTEIVTYRSADEAVEKVAYLLAHDDQRRAIAAAGERRTLRDHTIGQRAAAVHEIISGFLRE
jgi:spore maturation protein CgeB